MTAPFGFRHVKERGPRGWLARWWLRRRVKQIIRAMRES
jgi:hypothetical protein